jgi:hypothetical protein
MAQPRFFPASDLASDTGLESIFSGVFSLRDDPEPCRPDQASPRQPVPPPLGSAPGNRSLWEHLFGIVLLAGAAWAWELSHDHPALAKPLQYASLGSATVLAGRGLHATLGFDKLVWRLSDVLVFVAEIAVSMYLGYATAQAYGRRESIEEAIGKGPLWLLGFMILQEVIAFVQELSGNGNANRVAANDQPVNSDIFQPPASGPSPPDLPVGRSPSPPESWHGSAAQLEVYNPPATRSRSVSPTTGLPGLPLDHLGQFERPLHQPPVSSWSSGAGPTTRRSIPRNNTPPWARNPL